MIDEQYAAISAGTFDDLYIGDYWTIGGRIYRIAAFDYYYRTGDVECTKHHVTLVPDNNMYSAQYNNTPSGNYDEDNNTSVGRYVGSDIYKTGLNQAKEIIKAAFPGHVLNHRNLLANAVNEGAATNFVYVDSEVELMNENMVYGCIISSAMTNGVKWVANRRLEKSQLPLFASNPMMIGNRQHFWLRDVAVEPRFAAVMQNGESYSYKSSGKIGVRPAFSIF